MNSKKWNRKLGTSKREQGIVTPKMTKPFGATKAKKKARLLGKLVDFLKRQFK